jgi:hypothetical protein
LTEAEQVVPTVHEGAGGARNRMKFANAITSLLIDCGWVLSKLV